MKVFDKKFRLLVVFAMVGLLGGFLYWRFIGCSSGSCPITSNWYSSSLIGGLIGYLAGDSINDFRNKRKAKNGNAVE